MQDDILMARRVWVDKTFIKIKKKNDIEKNAWWKRIHGTVEKSYMYPMYQGQYQRIPMNTEWLPRIRLWMFFLRIKKDYFVWCITRKSVIQSLYPCLTWANNHMILKIKELLNKVNLSVRISELCNLMQLFFSTPYWVQKK